MHPNEQQVVLQQRAVRVFPTFQADQRETVLNEQVPCRTDDKQYRKTTEQCIVKFFPARKGFELIDGQQIDVADIAVFPENTIVSVVKIVAFSPVPIGHETNHTTHFSNKIVGFARVREGLVSAIVLDNEYANEKKRIDGSQWQYQPERYVNQKVHGHPDGYKWQKRVKYLYNGLPGIGQLVRFDDGGELLQEVWVVLIFKISH